MGIVEVVESGPWSSFNEVDNRGAMLNVGDLAKLSAPSTSAIASNNCTLTHAGYLHGRRIRLRYHDKEVLEQVPLHQPSIEGHFGQDCPLPVQVEVFRCLDGIDKLRRWNASQVSLDRIP